MAKTETITPFGPKKPITIKKGALTAQAKRAGKSISEFCAGKKSGVTAKRCALAKAFRHMKHK